MLWTIGDKHGVQNYNRFGELVLISDVVCDVSGWNQARKNTPQVSNPVGVMDMC